MVRKVKNLLKKIGRAYMRGAMELYGPVINCKLSPII